MEIHNFSPVSLCVDHLSVKASASSLGNGLFKRTPKPAAIDIEQIAADVSDKRQFILDDINLSVPSGHLMAIIGGSGSGKTSLLNAMARRISARGLKQTGSIRYNESEDISAISSAYVLQADILEPHLTARETLLYAADLRLTSSTKSHRHSFVEQIILELGLKECADTRVGDSSHRGLSGGEKRRLSIGIQLLSNPSLLFLDEPTTGLDANSAFLVVQTCQQLASHGRTLAMSLHQPRSDIFFLFDSITLLSRGHTVYCGPTRQAIPYFASLGYHLPEFTNPADFIIDLSAVDSRTAEKEHESSARVSALIDNWSQHGLSTISNLPEQTINEKSKEGERFSQSNSLVTSEESPPPVPKKSIFNEISTLTRRSVLVSLRDPMGYSGLLIEAIVMGIVCGWIFYKPGGSLAGIRSTMGAVYTSCAMQGYLLLLYETYRLCGPDLKVFDREHNEGCSTPAGFLISRRLAKMFTEDLFVPLIFSVIMYFMAGLRTDSASHFFIYFAVILLQHYNSVTFAALAASISRDFTIASLIANLGYTLQSFACGFFVNAEHMKPYIKWTKYIAHLWYALGAVMSNQFTGFEGDCPENFTTEQCYAYSGSYVLNTVGFPENWIWEPIIIVLCWSIFFYIVAWFFLTFLRVTLSMSSKKSSNDGELEDLENEESRVPTQLLEEDIGITVSVEDLSLSVKKRSSKKPPKIILSQVSATFEPGSLNAILGPSGSGKSTLLNYMAERLHSNAYQQYTQESGKFMFNGVEPTSKEISSLCSYVTQEDDGLLPSLTVRETLFYAACLRLPSSYSTSQKRQRADDIILKMGLKDCADTIIGNEMKKGISGGEKRRVSIAVQLLSGPRILLLDEPTSGLDSFTASSILEVLNGLADEGRTVISTIHQPRSDLFREFGNVLLLAKGGRIAYNGKGHKMVEYFNSLGHECPSTTNVADFSLDLVSVNLQTPEKEAVSRERVDELLSHWNPNNCESWGIVTHAPSINLDSLAKYKRSRPSFYVAFTTLVRRGFLNLTRSPDLLAARIMQIVGIGIIMALFFTPLRHGYVGVTNRIGLIQEVTALYFVGMLNNMAVYPADRAVFYREHDDGAYGVLPFGMAYLALELPFEAISSFLFSIFLVIVPGLPRTPGMYFAAVYSCFVIVNCGESLGIVFNTLFEHEGFALNIISTVLSLGSVMGGLLSLNMNVFLKALNWLSPLKYALGIMVNLAFENLAISCEGQAILPDGTCAFDSGEKVLESYHVKASVPHYCAGLVACIILYRALALGVLKINRLKLSFRKKSRF